MSNDLAGLFEKDTTAPAGTAKGATGAEPSTERRNKLFVYDAVAVQAFNPYGCSQFTDSLPEEVWNMVSKCNNRANFHSELASDDAWRIGAPMHFQGLVVPKGSYQHMMPWMKIIIEGWLNKMKDVNQSDYLGNHCSDSDYIYNGLGSPRVYIYIYISLCMYT